MIKVFSVLICLSILLSGCTAVGTGIGILGNEGPEYKTINQFNVLRDIEPGTEIFLELYNGETVEGELQLLEEHFESQNEKSDSTSFKKGYWKITLEISYKNYITYSSNEINTISVISKEGNNSIVTGILIGLGIDLTILLILYLTNFSLSG